MVLTSGVPSWEVMPKVKAAALKASDITGNSQSIASCAYALSKTGKAADARPLLDELFRLSAAACVLTYNFAVVYIALGEKKRRLIFWKKFLRK